MAAPTHLEKEPAPDWMGESLRELIFHIVEKHHSYARSELGRLEELADQVAATHRENHCELIQLRGMLELLREELRPHMMKEEQILFPFIAMLEDAILRGRSMPVPPFDTLEGPIRLMIREHQAATTLLGQIRAVTDDFHIPAFACASYRTLMRSLEDFDRNLHLHIHLENNILYPRAIALEFSGAKIEYEFANTCGEC